MRLHSKWYNFGTSCETTPESNPTSGYRRDIRQITSDREDAPSTSFGDGDIMMPGVNTARIGFRRAAPIRCQPRGSGSAKATNKGILDPKLLSDVFQHLERCNGGEARHLEMDISFTEVRPWDGRFTGSRAGENNYLPQNTELSSQ